MKKKTETPTDKIQKRHQLEEKLRKESKLVEKESMAVVREFEKFENKSETQQL